MLKRVKKKKPAVNRKLKKAPAKRKTAKKKPVKKAAHGNNNKDHWKNFKELKAKIETKLAKLKKDFKENKRPEDLIEDINMLGLLGGECNYMMRSLEKASKKKKPARR